MNTRTHEHNGQTDMDTNSDIQHPQHTHTCTHTHLHTSTQAHTHTSWAGCATKPQHIMSTTTQTPPTLPKIRETFPSRDGRISRVKQSKVRMIVARR